MQKPRARAPSCRVLDVARGARYGARVEGERRKSRHWWRIRSSSPRRLELSRPTLPAPHRWAVGPCAHPIRNAYTARIARASSQDAEDRGGVLEALQLTGRSRGKFRSCHNYERLQWALVPVHLEQLGTTTM